MFIIRSYILGAINPVVAPPQDAITSCLVSFVERRPAKYAGVHVRAAAGDGRLPAATADLERRGRAAITRGGRSADSGEALPPPPALQPHLEDSSSHTRTQPRPAVKLESITSMSLPPWRRRPLPPRDVGCCLY